VGDAGQLEADRRAARGPAPDGQHGRGLRGPLLDELEHRRGIFESAQAKELLTGTERAQFIPERTDVVRRLYEPDRVQFHITDSGYRGETYARDLSAHTKYIPDGKIIATTDDPYEGENLVEVYDGMVGVPVSEFRKPDFRQGQQSWVKLDTDSLTTYYHNASTRIPMINRPENIIIMDTQAVPA
jgi:hypothetical protein